MIIDSTYFRAEINVAQLGTEEVQENLEIFITKYEKRFLQNYFGYELAQMIVAENQAPNDPEIAKILNGAVITYQGKEYVWIGLKNEEKVSPIANFVFYYWAQDGISQQDGVGETWTKAENATLVSPDSRCAYAWNEMIEMLDPLEMFIKNYPERTGCNFKPINSFNL